MLGKQRVPLVVVVGGSLRSETFARCKVVL